MKELQKTKQPVVRSRSLKVGAPTCSFFFFFFFSLFTRFFFFFGRARRVFPQTLPALGGAAGACVFGTVYPAHANNGGAAQPQRWRGQTCAPSGGAAGAVTVNKLFSMEATYADAHIWWRPSRASWRQCLRVRGFVGATPLL
jgi:hypothetical protein